MSDSASTRNKAFVESMPRHPTQAETVLNYLRQRGFHGATRREIADALDIEPTSVCGRVKPMLISGLIIDSGKERIGVYGKGNHILLAKEFAAGSVASQIDVYKTAQPPKQLNLF